MTKSRFLVTAKNKKGREVGVKNLKPYVNFNVP